MLCIQLGTDRTLMYLIFDTETTGLPRSYKAPITDTDNWPRLVQLSWQLHAADGKLLNQQDYIVKPEGFTIPFNSEKVHGISTDRALQEGHALLEVLKIFHKDVEQAQVLVGHNVDFDINITGAEYVRTQMPTGPLMETQKLDTKTESTEFCAIPGGRGGRYKWPTLSELHNKLFSVGFDEAHNSAFDVDATARCFFGLLKERVVKPHSNEVPLEQITYEAPDLEASSRAAEKEQESAAPTIPVTDQPVKAIKTAPFSHLHVHSQYSILQSTASIKQLVEAAKKMEMPAVAFTDLGNLFGAFKAVAEGKKQGVKVIIGCDVYLVEDRHQKKFTKDRKDQRSLQLLLAKNQEGFQNLSKLCSLGYIEGYYGGFPRVDKELIQKYRQGLVATTGSISGEVPDLILNVGEHQAEEAFVWWKDTFGEDFYVELQRHGLEEENRVNDILQRFAKKYDVKVIATNDVYYANKQDSIAHENLLCVKNGDTMSMPKGRGRGHRFALPNNEFYFKSEDEMKRLFQDLPEAITNTYEIVEKTEELTLERDILLPKFEIPEEFTDQDDYLRHLTYEGAKSRYPEISDEIRERIDHELKIIKDMGFPGYFLIVQDFINEARQMDVKVGPGRGSAAGSVVAYCTGITNIDPIRYDLLFERFLNPERISMPDIDIDFDDDGRQKVIDYVIDKYGQNQVAQIVTFGTMAPKMSIRDVARVSELPLAEANYIAKLVPEKPGTTFEQALTEVPELQQIKRGQGPQSKVVNLAQTLVGSVRGTGIHAAGVIIAPNDLLEYIPVKTDKDTDLFITQFDGSVVESAGMLKMDFLGLKTLTIIKTALETIKQNYGVDIDMDTIPLDDPKTFELYQRGDTVGTFQFESEGMRQWLQKLKPTDIEDLIAMNALYRPGPMQFIPNFIDRKHGREKVEYPHPLLEVILKNTYGIMVYQEQIMQTAQILGGYSLGGADLLRRAMGKKKIEEMNKQRIIFVEGAKEKHGIDQAKAEEVFSIMEKFAQYGFNRCLTGDTRITDAISGRMYTIEELYRRRPELHVHALAENGKLRTCPVTDYIYNGEKPVFELRTQQGKVIKATANHPFRTFSGWTLLQDLQIGDHIAAPRQLSVASTHTWENYKLITLAGLISEGNTCHSSCLYFFSNDYSQIEDFATAIEKFPDTVTRIYARSDKRYEVCASTGHKPSFGTPQIGPIRSGAFTWAGELGLLGKKATEKFVPAEIFELSDACLELFLGRLWAGDGFIANAKEHIPFYATSSARLAKDVQYLLLRLGIQSGVHIKKFKYRNTFRTGYTVRLIGENVLELFLERVACHALGRENAVQLLADYLDSTTRGLTSKDTVPASVRKIVNTHRQLAGFNWKELEQTSGYSMREFMGIGSHDKKAFRRSTLAGIASTLNSDELLQIAESDIFWDQIVSITPAGTAPTYDITVDDDHNFVANGLIVHNSHSAAYSVVAYQTGYLKANYPAEYMAAVLTHNMNNSDKATLFLDECKRQGIPVLGPDVNESSYFFGPNQEGQIRFGLGGIKGAGENAVSTIIEERMANGPFQDIFEFTKRLNQRPVNKKTMECLAMAGAFDSFDGLHRRQYIFAENGDGSLLEKAMKYAATLQQEEQAAQQTLFSGSNGFEVPKPRIPNCEPYSEIEKLKIEKDMVGFYISGHPLDQFKLEIENFCTCTVDKVENYKNQEISVAGIITSFQERTTRTGKPFALVTIEDYQASMGLAFFGEDYLSNRHRLVMGQFIYVKGRVEERYNQPGVWELQPRNVQLLSEIREKMTAGVQINIPVDMLKPQIVAQLEQLLTSYQGSCRLKVCLQDGTENIKVDTMSRRFKVSPVNAFFEELEKMRELSYKLESA